MNNLVTVLAVFSALVSIGSFLITESCIDCLKTVEGGVANACDNNDGVEKCGEYRLSEAFYDTCSIPEAGWDWQTCAFDDTCARWCIKLYMQIHQNTCAGFLGGSVSDMCCHTYGRIFNHGGADGCNTTATCPYVATIRGTCYAGSTISHAQTFPAGPLIC